MKENEYTRLRERVEVDANFMGIDSDDALKCAMRECCSYSDVRRLQRKVESVLDDYRLVREEIAKAVPLSDEERELLDGAIEESPDMHRLLVEAACSKVTLSHCADDVDWSAYEDASYTHLDWPVWMRRIVLKDSTANTPDWHQIIAQSRIHWLRSIRIAMRRAMRHPFYSLAVSVLKRGITATDVRALGLLADVSRRVAECESYLRQLGVLAERIESSQESVSVYEDDKNAKRERLAETLANKLKNILIPMEKNCSVDDFARDLMLSSRDTEVINIINRRTRIRSAEKGVLKALYDELVDAGLYHASYSNFYKMIKA